MADRAHSTTSRRALLAAPILMPIAAAAGPTPPTPTPMPAANPDAELIRKAEAFIARQMQVERDARRLGDGRTPEGRAEWLRLCHADGTRYFQRLDTISCAEPTTREGLIAQAMVVMFEFNEVDGDPHHALAWNLAESVLRVFGVPLPSWAASEANPLGLAGPA